MLGRRISPTRPYSLSGVGATGPASATYTSAQYSAYRSVTLQFGKCSLDRAGEIDWSSTHTYLGLVGSTRVWLASHRQICAVCLLGSVKHVSVSEIKVVQI